MNGTEIERFVRDTLGCACPDEVFQRIEYGPPPAALAALGVERRLLVGGRLLAYIVPCGPQLPALDPLVEAGRGERDREGYNRFRLVLATTDPEQARTATGLDFAAAAGADDRVHLHVIDAAGVPAAGGRAKRDPPSACASPAAELAPLTLSPFDGLRAGSLPERERGTSSFSPIGREVGVRAGALPPDGTLR